MRRSGFRVRFPLLLLPGHERITLAKLHQEFLQIGKDRRFKLRFRHIHIGGKTGEFGRYRVFMGKQSAA